MFEPYLQRRANFTISTDPAQLDVAFLHKFLSEEAAWARGIARETLERAIAHSLCFGLYDAEAERQIGFARVISDYATYAYLDDVFVLTEYRGRGLGAWLMECIVAHPNLQGLKRFALTTMDKQEFYAHFGWRALYYPERHMEKLPPGYYSLKS
ncbi:MAG: GNAT family N-acetyltransferase [Anaerolineales bacterium]|nr:GNAT family N-acetyltransferase [Anaerolineales bacterium]